MLMGFFLFFHVFACSVDRNRSGYCSTDQRSGQNYHKNGDGHHETYTLP